MPLSKHIIQRIQKKDENEVNLANANIRDKDVDELIDLLNQHKNIVSVDLSHNNMSNEGIRKLVALSHVYSLNISFEPRFNDETAILLINAAHFTHLDFSRNSEITDVAGRQMLLNATQAFLNIERTSINSELQKEIGKRINENRLRHYENIKKHASNTTRNSPQTCSSAFFNEKENEHKDPSAASGTPLTANVRSSNGKKDEHKDSSAATSLTVNIRSSRRG